MKTIDRARAALRHRLRAPVAWAIRWRERQAAARLEHELGICAIFRDEAPFLDEWISFHVGVGATHFYLYNNFSTDEFKAVLAPWIARGMVTLTDWPVALGQVPAYRHCLARARRECRWLAFIDVDEFLFSPAATDVRDILRGYADLPGLAVWQLFFGSSGHAARPALPVTEAYVKRATLAQTKVKTIVNPRMVYKVGVHQCKYWHGTDLDTSRRPITSDRAPVLDVLRINHYWSRSLEDLALKAKRGVASPAPDRTDTDWYFRAEASLNAETDEAILPLARAIRQAAVPDEGAG
jgi:hypothetical protein